MNSTEADGRMHSKDVKIVDLVRETHTNKRKNQNRKGRVRAGSRNGKSDEEGPGLQYENNF
jgi:hypothetical protein